MRNVKRIAHKRRRTACARRGQRNGRLIIRSSDGILQRTKVIGLLNRRAIWRRQIIHVGLGSANASAVALQHTRNAGAQRNRRRCGGIRYSPGQTISRDNRNGGNHL